MATSKECSQRGSGLDVRSSHGHGGQYRHIVTMLTLMVQTDILEVLMEDIKIQDKASTMLVTGIGQGDHTIAVKLVVYLFSELRRQNLPSEENKRRNSQPYVKMNSRTYET